MYSGYINVQKIQFYFTTSKQEKALRGNKGICIVILEDDFHFFHFGVDNITIAEEIGMEQDISL